MTGLNHAMRGLNLLSYEFDELAGGLYGRAAVGGGRLRRGANVAGEDWGGSYLVAELWVGRDGFRRVGSRHATLLPIKK